MGFYEVVSVKIQKNLGKWCLYLTILSEIGSTCIDKCVLVISDISAHATQEKQGLCCQDQNILKLGMYWCVAEWLNIS